MRLLSYLVSTALAALATVVSAQAPDPRPGPSTPVTVVNTPLPVTGQVTGNVSVSGSVNATITGTPQVKIVSDHVPFAKTLCLPSCTPNSPDHFTVPSQTADGSPVKELVIDFASGSCTGTGRAGEVELAATTGSPTIADTGDNFSRNTFPLAVDQYDSALGQNGLQAFAHQTRITYLPGTLVSTTFSIMQAGVIFCRIQLNGHFVTT